MTKRSKPVDEILFQYCLTVDLNACDEPVSKYTFDPLYSKYNAIFYIAA